jgi:hypothetical protein
MNLLAKEYVAAQAEVFAFPNGLHDDQIDSISQALAHEVSGYDLSNMVKGLAGLVDGLEWISTWVLSPADAGNGAPGSGSRALNGGDVGELLHLGELGNTRMHVDASRPHGRRDVRSRSRLTNDRSDL